MTFQNLGLLQKTLNLREAALVLSDKLVHLAKLEEVDNWKAKLHIEKSAGDLVQTKCKSFPYRNEIKILYGLAVFNGILLIHKLFGS